MKIKDWEDLKKRKSKMMQLRIILLFMFLLFFLNPLIFGFSLIVVLGVLLKISGSGVL